MTGNTHTYTVMLIYFESIYIRIDVDTQLKKNKRPADGGLVNFWRKGGLETDTKLCAA